MEHLASYSGAGRLHKQDAVSPSKIKDPHALLTLPEFIREPLPATARSRPPLEDPRALLTLPEFVREPPPPHLDEIDAERPEIDKLKKANRSRSSSAPSLSWLLSSPSRSGSISGTLSRSRSRPKLQVPSMPSSELFRSLSSIIGVTDRDLLVGFEVNYVAENHENLHHVLVFFTVTGPVPGIDIEAEVLPPPLGKHTNSGRLVITSGPRTSLPLILPARVLSGKQTVAVQSGHFEIKLTTIPPQGVSPTEDAPPLLDAAQLSSANPTSFICASCSLPLVQSTKIQNYRDLPSEHWAELVEAWMCHTDQKLHDQAVKHGQMGFWPQPGQCLVGGSYILFEESDMSLQNLHRAQENKVRIYFFEIPSISPLSGRSRRPALTPISDHSPHVPKVFRAGACGSSKP